MSPAIWGIHSPGFVFSKVKIAAIPRSRRDSGNKWLVHYRNRLNISFYSDPSRILHNAPKTLVKHDNVGYIVPKWISVTSLSATFTTMAGYMLICCIINADSQTPNRTVQTLDRTIIQSMSADNWATSWQNKQNDGAPSEDSDQPKHPPSLIRVFAVRMKKAWVLSYPLSAQRRLWSDWADAQADLRLRWAHMPFCWFCHEATQLCFSVFLTTWTIKRISLSEAHLISHLNGHLHIPEIFFVLLKLCSTV